MIRRVFVFLFVFIQDGLCLSCIFCFVDGQDDAANQYGEDKTDRSQNWNMNVEHQDCQFYTGECQDDCYAVTNVCETFL